jgi:ATP-dependent helicase HrpA
LLLDDARFGHSGKSFLASCATRLFDSSRSNRTSTADVREAAEPPRLVVSALFSRLIAAEQQRVLQSTHQCKVTLASNIAETSVTISGVRTVVDSGLAASGARPLQIEKISQASAEQRKGRWASACACTQAPPFTDP